MTPRMEKLLRELLGKDVEAYTAPEPPNHSPNWNEDPFVPRNPYDIQNGDYNRPEPEDALNKDRPRGAPSKISALIRHFLGNNEHK